MNWSFQGVGKHRKTVAVRVAGGAVLPRVRPELRN